MKKLLALVVMVLTLGCSATVPSNYTYKLPVKISQEIHYDQKDRLIGRTHVKEYADESIIKTHYDEAGKYIGTSRTNKE